MSVWISDEKLLIFASLISPSKMILFEKKYQTFDTVFHHQMKHLEVRQKYSATRRIFNSLLGVSSGDETLRLMFDILRHCQQQQHIQDYGLPSPGRPYSTYLICNVYILFPPLFRTGSYRQNPGLCPHCQMASPKKSCFRKKAFQSAVTHQLPPLQIAPIRGPFNSFADNMI